MNNNCFDLEKILKKSGSTYENTELFKAIAYICNFTTKALWVGIDWGKCKVIQIEKWEVIRHRQGLGKPLTLAYIDERGSREKEIVA